MNNGAKDSTTNLQNYMEMNIIMPNIFSDVRVKGYVIFNLKNSDLPNYYPGAFNKYPGVNIHQLKIYDLITIKIFVADGDGNDLPRIIDGYIDLTIESIEGDKVIADILTALPENFPLEIGDSMELLEEEILFCVPVDGYLKGTTVN
jgi:hypothetical protein